LSNEITAITANNGLNANYQEQLNYQIKCLDSDQPQRLTFSFTGTPASFNSTIVRTSKADLGIVLLRNFGRQKLNLNQSSTFNSNTPTFFSVAPVKRSPTTFIPSGEFTSNVYLQISYD